MAHSEAPIPKGPVHFAGLIIEKCRLDKASQIGFVEQMIRSAIREAEDIEHARELIGCSPCGIILSRYSAIRQEFVTLCPRCRHPTASLADLKDAKIGKLEARIQQLEAELALRPPG